MIWLAQSTDNSKWFAWSPRLWGNESGLYMYMYIEILYGNQLLCPTGEDKDELSLPAPSGLRYFALANNTESSIDSNNRKYPIHSDIMMSTCNGG